MTENHHNNQIEPSYQRWEVCVSNRFNLNSYVGYCKAQFEQEQRDFVVIKARGAAIENALKVVQLVKENIGCIHSYTNFTLQQTSDRRYFEEPVRATSGEWALGTMKPKSIPRRERLISTFREYETVPDFSRIVPSIEVKLSKVDLHPEGHAGHQEANPMVKPILVGQRAMRNKNNPRVL